jgi:hypothetical protein
VYPERLLTGQKYEMKYVGWGGTIPCILDYCTIWGPGSSVGIETDYGLDGPGIESRWGEIFRCPDWPWGPPSLLYSGYRVFHGGKVRLGRAVDHSPPSNDAVKKG